MNQQEREKRKQAMVSAIKKIGKQKASDITAEGNSRYKEALQKCMEEEKDAMFESLNKLKQEQ
jgi:DNA topoisomerase VI subunit B